MFDPSLFGLMEEVTADFLPEDIEMSLTMPSLEGDLADDPGAFFDVPALSLDPGIADDYAALASVPTGEAPLLVDPSGLPGPVALTTQALVDPVTGTPLMQGSFPLVDFVGPPSPDTVPVPPSPSGLDNGRPDFTDFYDWAQWNAEDPWSLPIPYTNWKGPPFLGPISIQPGPGVL